MFAVSISDVASGTDDTTVDLIETLNLGSGEAGGSDVHYGIRYRQTQTDLTGWDSVYLMYLNGGSGKVIAVDNNANILLNDNRKVVFGDAGEYIAGDGTDLDIVSSNEVVTTAGGDVIVNTGRHFNVDAAENIELDAGSDEGAISFKTSGTTYASISHHHSATWLDIYENGAAGSDLLSIKVLANAEVEIITLDNAGALAHINIEADGHVEFDGCAVGFDLVAPTYNASDTDVDFTTGNKQFVLFGSGNITDLNLIFPDTTGNFVLLLKQDGTGSRTVTNYKAWDLVNSDAADGSATVKFAGGSNPTLTTDANHVDIISIFWDADNEIAYGVASLDFQF